MTKHKSEDIKMSEALKPFSQVIALTCIIVCLFMFVMNFMSCEDLSAYSGRQYIFNKE